MNLLEKAKKHQTVNEANRMLNEALDALEDEAITNKRSNKISKAVNKRQKQLCKKLKESGDLDKYYNPD